MRVGAKPHLPEAGSWCTSRGQPRGERPQDTPPASCRFHMSCVPTVTGGLILRICFIRDNDSLGSR